MAMMRQESLPDRYSFECLSADGVKFFFIIVENTWFLFEKYTVAPYLLNQDRSDLNFTEATTTSST